MAKPAPQSLPKPQVDPLEAMKITVEEVIEASVKPSSPLEGVPVTPAVEALPPMPQLITSTVEKFRLVRDGRMFLSGAFVYLKAGQVLSAEYHPRAVQTAREWGLELEPVSD